VIGFVNLSFSRFRSQQAGEQHGIDPPPKSFDSIYRHDGDLLAESVGQALFRIDIDFFQSEMPALLLLLQKLPSYLAQMTTLPSV
jgi:hypothetical protein